MKYILLSFFFIHSLYATSVDMVELYRTQGLQAVEKEITRQLQTKKYWDTNLENKVVTNGYYESIQFVLICQKDQKNMKLYDTKTKVESLKTDVFVGEVSGDKKIEGDLKTPLGAYKLKRRITNVDPFYGPLAITTNYPNIYDKSQGKTGHGIWIHGVPEKGDRDNFTQGCIALDNQKILNLDKSINLDKSMLVISEKKLHDVSKDDMSTILSNIFKWRDAWKQSDIRAYLSFYAEDFKKANGESFDKFAQYKTRIFNKNEKKTIEFSNINVIPYPNDQNKKLFKVIMDEVYKTRTYTFNGKKELYIEISNNEIKILTEG